MHAVGRGSQLEHRARCGKEGKQAEVEANRSRLAVLGESERAAVEDANWCYRVVTSDLYTTVFTDLA